MTDPVPPSRPAGQAGQLIGSLLGAVVLIAAVVTVVSARIPPQGVGDPDDRHDAAEAREEAAEEAAEAREEAAEGEADKSGRRRRGRGGRD